MAAVNQLCFRLSAEFSIILLVRFFIPKDLSTSLLSLQLGFANELTGVENAVLGAMYLGHTKQEALARLPKILEFAEIGEWANESLFTYSTGMKARLGFAVALEMNPDIMLIDETMGVGDAYFQKKSTTELIKKMQSGQTTVLVSHSEDTIRSLCNRVFVGCAMARFVCSEILIQS